jgi:hypothetical protein
MALRIESSFLMHATNATFLGLPAARPSDLSESRQELYDGPRYP